MNFAKFFRLERSRRFLSLRAAQLVVAGFLCTLVLVASKPPSEAQRLTVDVNPSLREAVLTNCLRDKFRIKFAAARPVDGHTNLEVYFQNNLKNPVSEVSFRVSFEDRNLKSEIRPQTWEFSPPLGAGLHRLVEIENASVRSIVEEKIRVEILVDDIKFGIHGANQISEPTKSNGLEADASSRFQHFHSVLCF